MDTAVRSAAAGGSTPSRASRALVIAHVMIAVAIGAAAAAGTLLAAYLMHRAAPGGSDLDQTWFAARAMLHGQDPYALIGPGRALSQTWPWLYPLPAAILVLPLAPLPVLAARALFVGLSFGGLAFALARRIGYARLPFVLLNASAIAAVTGAQWAPLLMLAWLIPSAAAVLIAKPSIGFAVAASGPSRQTVRIACVWAAVLVAASLAIQPTWPREWLAALHHTSHMLPPIMHPAGIVVGLALLRWRRAEARLLLALACVPQTPLVYSTLVLFLVPRSIRELAVFALLSDATQMVQSALVPRSDPGPGAARMATLILVGLQYIPALVMVLRRPNEGRVPEWLDRFLRGAGSTNHTVGQAADEPILPQE